MFQEFVIAKRLARDAANAQITQAWWGVMLDRQKTLKGKPSDYWNKGPTQPQSAAEMKATLQRLAKQYGGTVQQVGT